MLSPLRIQAYVGFQRKWCQACDVVLSNHIPSFRPMYVPNPSATNHCFPVSPCIFFSKSMVQALGCTILYLKHPLLQDPRKWKRKVEWKVHISGNLDDKGLRCLLMKFKLLPTGSPPCWLTWHNAYHYLSFHRTCLIHTYINILLTYLELIDKTWSGG